MMFAHDETDAMYVKTGLWLQCVAALVLFNVLLQLHY